jgi:serine protein kinase
MEESIENIVSYFRHAAQGLEEKKQILYLLGPVGGGKSSLAEKLKSLIEKMPLLRDQGLAGARVAAGAVQPGGRTPCDPRGRLRHPAALPQHHHEPVGGEAPARVQRRHHPLPGGQAAPLGAAPGRRRQDRAGRREQPGHLVAGGQDRHPQARAVFPGRPDAYSYSGGLCLANRGLLEFVEMFKAPIKVLHPLLTATQEGNYKGTEGFGAIPFDGIVMAHSNESEWVGLQEQPQQRGLPRPHLHVKVPYCLRVSDEVKIYEKLLANSSLSRGAVRPRHPQDDGAVRGAVARSRSPRTPASSPRCGSMTARTSRTPTPRPRATRSTATTPASTRA